MSKPSILFIGLGNMGNPIAANLLRAGYRLTLADLDEDKLANLIPLGGIGCADLITSAGEADVVFLSLPGPAQVEGLLFGQGLLAAMKPGAGLIDTTTSSVELARHIGAQAERQGVQYLESPVTNAIDGAREGRLGIFAAGDRRAFDAYMPIFEVIGEKIFYVGVHGNGATIKLITNLLWFVHAAAVGEGLMLGAKAGISLDIVAEAIKASAGNSWVAEHDIPSIFAGHYDPSFSLDLCCKDLRLAHEIAADQGLELKMGSLARERFEEARKTYGGAAAELHVVKLIEDSAGLLLRPPHGQKP
jgi:3-hydroxyisobutyrate dehydrogenase-like beta-hydroxyacid dehydrogenase